jgi:hypothetical protein
MQSIVEDRRRGIAVRCGAIASVQKAIRDLEELNKDDLDFDYQVALRFLGERLRALQNSL